MFLRLQEVRRGKARRRGRKFLSWDSSNLRNPHAIHTLHLDASSCVSISSPHCLPGLFAMSSNLPHRANQVNPLAVSPLSSLWLLLIAFCHCDGMASGLPGASYVQRLSVLLALYSWASTAPGKIPDPEHEPGTQPLPAGQGHPRPLVLTYPSAGKASLQPWN